MGPVGSERLWWWPHPLCVTQQYRLASMAAWLSSTGTSHHNLLPHIPLICLSAVNRSPRPGIAPQSLNSSSQSLHLLGDLRPYVGYVWHGWGKDCLILIPFSLPQISCFTLSLKCFSSDSDNCPCMGMGPLLQFPHLPRAGPVLLTLLFFCLVPPSYRVLHGSIYSFPLVRYSCPLSTGVLHALLCLKVYSWCIRGERCTPRPPTPPPSCSLLPLVLNTIFSEIFPLPRKKNSPSVIIFLKTWGKNKVCRKENKYPYHIVCMWGLSSCEEL